MYWSCSRPQDNEDSTLSYYLLQKWLCKSLLDDKLCLKSFMDTFTDRWWIVSYCFGIKPFTFSLKDENLTWNLYKQRCVPIFSCCSINKRLTLFCIWCFIEVVCSQRGRIRLPGRSWGSYVAAATGRPQHWFTHMPTYSYTHTKLYIG